MIALVVIAVAVIYLTCAGMTFQLTEPLEIVTRSFAACIWPITTCLAAGIAIARHIQARRRRPPRAIARERKTESS